MDVEENTECFLLYFAMLHMKVTFGKMPISLNFVMDLRFSISLTQLKCLPAFFCICCLNYGQEDISIFVIFKSRRNALKMQTLGIFMP